VDDVIQWFAGGKEGIWGLYLETMENINVDERERREHHCASRVEASLRVTHLVHESAQGLCKKNGTVLLR
jgi:hypothetical protein